MVFCVVPEQQYFGILSGFVAEVFWGSDFLVLCVPQTFSFVFYFFSGRSLGSELKSSFLLKTFLFPS